MIANLQHIDLGDAGVEQTLRAMRRLVVESARSPVVIEWARSVVRGLPERDPDATAEAFLRWVRANVRYLEDPVDVELVTTPESMLLEWRQFGQAQEDCDSQVVLIAAGLNAVGIETEFIVVAADSGAPNDFSHVLLQYAGRDGWTSLDPIVRGTGLGFFPPRVSRVGKYHRGRLTGSRGGGGLGLVAVGVGAYLLLASNRRRRR